MKGFDILFLLTAGSAIGASVCGICLSLLFRRIYKDNPLRSGSNDVIHIIDRPTDWSHDEAMYLRRFLETPTGKTFLARARKIEARTAVIGAHDLMHSAHSAGVTVGFGDCLNWIESLASDKMISDSVAVTTEQQTADADKDGSEPVEPRRHF